MNKQLITLSLIGFILFSCGNNSDSISLDWTPIDSINQDMPDGIKVYHAYHTDSNLRAWYVEIQEALPNIESRVVVSTDEDRRETISDFANRLAVPVMINGGYFRMDLNPAKHVGLLKVNNEMIHSATPSVLRGEQRFYLHRSAIGFDSTGVVGIEWVSSHSDTVYKWSEAIQNVSGIPGAKRDSSYSQIWTARDILGGGPQLIKAGIIDIAIDEEVFFGTSIPEVHPRTAAGITRAGNLILLLVDGRQLVSRGVDLEELAQILYDLGCEEALNLDGGGSSTLVVNGTLLNRPGGKTTQREVMSAIAVFSH